MEGKIKRILSRRERSELFYRWATAILFVPVLLFVTSIGGIYYLIFIEGVVAIGSYEFYKILERRGLKPFVFIGIMAGMVLAWNSYYASHLFTFFTLTTLVIFISISELQRKNIDRAIYHITVTLFGVFYVSWLFSHLILLRQLPIFLYHHIGMANIHKFYEYFFFPDIRFAPEYKQGALYAMIPFVLAWLNDSAAYFVGNKFGRHKILKRVSPSKSWEGAIGGGIMGMIGIFVFRGIFAPWLNVLDCVILGIMGAFLAPAGDLVESLLKRDVQIKDAAKTIPGHGGLLDRFDSVLFVAPAVYYYLMFFVVRR